ncbi:MAG: hypothetical protein B9S32_03900 [Verrucomicrobia bacterium Tous-C9LFEB]|nr:MAG: hypothetical protein B9S32_03900 [Verrucomicrobia bacterium Tous-C9LFEB]
MRGTLDFTDGNGFTIPRMTTLSSQPNPSSLPEVWSHYLEDYITALEWSPEGDRIAAGSADGALKIFNAADGKELWSLEGHEQGLDSLSWRPDGKALASGGQDGQVKFWFLDGANVRCVAAPGGASWVEHVEWSHPDNPDPRYPRLASSSGKKLKLWDYEGKLVREFPEHEKTILDVQWHPNRPLLASAIFGAVQIWGAKDGDLHKKYDAPFATLKLSWSGNGQWLVTGNQDSSVHLWRTKTGEEMHMRGYETKVRELSWDATNTFLAAGGSSVISVWDCAGEGPAGRTPERLEWHAELVSALAFSHHGFVLASGSLDGNLAVWEDVVPSRPPTGVARMSGEVTQLAWSPDDRLLAVADSQGAVRMYRVKGL